MSTPPPDAPAAAPAATARVINQETNLSDLTDQEIIALSQQMNEDSEAENRPLLSSAAPLSVLREEYIRGTPIFVDKIDTLLKDGWTSVWRAKGDGDCFYRAFALAYSLRILNSPDPAQAAELAKQKVNDCIPRFEAAGYMELVYEDFLSTLLLHLSSLALPTCSSSSVLSALQDPEQSNSIVVVLRLITSSFIRANAGDYEHFLVHPETGEMMGVRDFCVGEVEACGREADNVQIMALASCLDVPIKIAYLDASGSGSHIDMHSFGPEGQTNPLTLLYRPGHYDYLQ